MLDRVFLILCLVFICSSCQKNTVDFINIFITPSSQNQVMNSEEVIPFSVRLESNNELTELVIIETINNVSLDTILVQLISGNERIEYFNYTCPNISSEDTSEVKLIFSCINSVGDKVERAKVFFVVSKDVYLTETTGHTMHSSNSIEFNAYNLLEGQPMFNTDTTYHIGDNTDSIVNILSREWISKTGLLFSKNNSFDYANATSDDLESTYNSSLKKEFVNDIQVSDIIITLINNVYIVIRVDQVIDDTGSHNDRYIFSIKK